MALWLVDPHLRILSTASVLPQQADWRREDLKAHDEKSFSEGCMILDETVEHRRALMKERAAAANVTRNV
jgi:hypothetical protein